MIRLTSLEVYNSFSITTEEIIKSELLSRYFGPKTKPKLFRYELLTDDVERDSEFSSYDMEGEEMKPRKSEIFRKSKFGDKKNMR